MKIALLGSGMMGSVLGSLWGRAGHEVAFSSRHPETLESLASSVPNARVLPLTEAAEFCEVAFLGVPFHATRTVGSMLAPALQGKVLLDAGNLIPNRDGEEAIRAKEAGGSGLYTQQAFEGVRVVKAFNTVYFKVLENGKTPSGEIVGVPLAGDDEAALAIAEQLVADAGADPVRIGGLRDASRIDFGSPVWNANLTATGIRSALSLPPTQ